MINRLICYLC